MKILNLYAGIGGNRKLWGDTHSITAVEYDQATADVYQKFFPKDTVVVADAHEYLMQHHEKFDFIWSSPPCPSHSRMRMLGVSAKQFKPIFPDFKLYEEIIFLKRFAHKNTKWVIENVIPYYKPLVEPTIKIDRHFYWSNFQINPQEIIKKEASIRYVKAGDKRFGFSVEKTKLKNKAKALRNLVNPKVGKHILDCALTNKSKVFALNGAAKQDFVTLTSNDTWFKQHPEKIAGKEYQTTSLHFPIQVKGTKEDVLRVTSIKSEKSALILKSNSRKRRLRLLSLKY